MSDEPTVKIDNGAGQLVDVPASQAPPVTPPLVHRAPAPPPKQRTSLVAGHNDWDFTLYVEGLPVYCKQWSPELAAWINEGFYNDVAAALGCTLEVAKDVEALGYWVRSDETGEREKALESLQTAQYDRIITEGVVDWGSPEPCDQFKLQMPLAIKRTLALAYGRACKFGQRSDFLS